jgi:hypothetical protein
MPPADFCAAAGERSAGGGGPGKARAARFLGDRHPLGEHRLKEILLIR